MKFEENMTSRQRVMMAIDHKETDRVPLDFGSTMVSALTLGAYNKLRNFLGLEKNPNPVISNRNMFSVFPKDDILEYYNLDCHSVHGVTVGFFNAEYFPDTEEYIDEYNVKWRSASFYFDVVGRPLADKKKEDLKTAKWPDTSDKRRVSGLRKEAKRLFKETDYCLVLDIMCNGPFEQACKLRGHDKFLLDLYIDRPYAEELMDRIIQKDMELWDMYLDEIKDYVQIVAQGDDVGMQTGLFLSPKMYREIIKPYEKRLFDFIHSKTKAKLFYHSCGSVYDIIPDLIEIGVDILNPVQTGAAKMDLISLKKEFGKDITFWGGGIDTQMKLNRLSVMEIKEEVRRNIEIMGPGGGYIFAPTHNIQADVPPEKIDAIYQAAFNS